MASEFLVDGDLFVEVVDNNDGGGIPSKHLAAPIGTAPLIRPLSHLSVLTVITVCANSTAEKDRRRTSSAPGGAAVSILSSFLTFQVR